MKFKIFLFACLWLVLPMRGQVPMVRNFNSINYLGGRQNWAIDQAPDDRMLFANDDGLLLFDGDKWDIFPLSNFTSVRSVLYDKKKCVAYVGGTDEFGFFYRNNTNFSPIYHSISSRLPLHHRSFGEIWNIHKLRSGVVFESKHCLYFFRNDGVMKIQSVPFRIETTAVFNDRLIVSCREQNYVFDGKQLTILPSAKTLRGKSVRAILPLFHQILFVTANNGLYLYDWKSLSPFVLDITPHLQTAQVFCATATPTHLAFGTVKDGLIVKNIITGKNWYANALTGLQNNTILSIKFDRNLNIWLGLDNGISYVMMETPFSDLLGYNNNVGTGYASIVDGNRLYLGTNLGLFYMSSALSDITAESKPIPIPQLTGQIWCLRKIGNRLFCGADAGTFTVSGDKVVKVKGTQGTWNLMALKRHPGYILANDYQGFFILRQTDAGVELVNRVTGFSETGAGFEEDADGSFWFSHWRKGIYHFWLSDDLRRIEKIQHFYRGNGLPTDDNNLVAKFGGRIYITSVDGFRYYNAHSGKLEKAEKMNHVFNTYGQALRITELPDGKLWAYKDNYLAVARPTRRGYAVKRLAFGNLVRRLQVNFGHISALTSAHTLLNYDNGFYVMNDDYKGNEGEKHFFLRAVWGTEGKDTLLYAHYPGLREKEIALPHSLNSIRMEFVMPEYRDDRAVSYVCKLEGYDEKWSAPQTSTSKEYTQLKKGHYTFRVKATNQVTGQVSELSMNLRVLPAWYETPAAYFIYLLLAVFCLYYLYRYMQRRSEQKLARLKEEKERQLKEQRAQFLIQEEKKEKELVELRNEQLTVELKHKSGELADSTMNLVRKNDMLKAIDEQMAALSESVRGEDTKSSLTKKINDIRRGIKGNMADDDNWEKFQENFNLVYDNFMQKLTSRYPTLKKNDLKLCAYLKMGLSSKEMASLLNTSVRSIETARYRLRKKLELESGDNLTVFIQDLEKEP